MDNTLVFSKEDTRAVKGAAILLMLFHHLAAFPARLPEGFAGFAMGEVLSDVAYNAVFCVPLFFFLGGYGMYKKYAAGGSGLTGAVVSLYRRYWRVFLIFVPIAFIFFHNTPADSWQARYTASTPKQYITVLLGNFLGYRSSLNSEWWFFGAYLCVLPLGWMFCRFIRRRNDPLADIFLVGLISILTGAVFPALANIPALSSLGVNIWYARFLQLNQYSPAFFSGIVFARYDWLVSLKRLMARLPLRALTGAVGCAAVILVRCYVTADVSGEDVLLTPLFAAFFSTALDGMRPVRPLFTLLGRHSANMWLIHTFFCYYFPAVAKLVFCTENLWVDLLILTALSLGASWLLERIYALLGRGTARLRARKTVSSGS